MMTPLPAVAAAVGALLAPAAPAAAAPAPAAPHSWCTTDRFGARTWPGGQITYNNEWNSGSSQRMCANGPGNVRVVARQSATGGARSCPVVLSYPAVQYDLPAPAGQPIPGTPIGKLREVRSTYAESQPGYPKAIGEFASDDWWWVASQRGQEAYEVMSWEDNQGQSPGGTEWTGHAGHPKVITVAGHLYRLWDGGTLRGPAPHGYYAFLRTTRAGRELHATSGYVPHLAEARWLIGHGLMDPGVTFAQEEIGWEICTDPPGGGTYRITANRLTVRKQAGR
jgi:hypothetical protein